MERIQYIYGVGAFSPVKNRLNMYGYPSHESFEEAEEGNLKLDGCEILIDGFAIPDRFCKDCETEWCVDRFEVDAITKVRFKYWSNWRVCDLDSIVKKQWEFEIFSDGTIKCYAYSRQSRRVLDKDKVLVDIGRVKEFYEKLIDAFNLFETCNHKSQYNSWRFYDV